MTPTPRVRHAVRAVVLSEPDPSVLLLRMQRPDGAGDFWLLPGGGIQAGEDSLAALRREVWEETGLSVACTPPLLWRRVHTFGRGVASGGVPTEQHEDIYLIRTRRFAPTARHNPEPSEVGIFREFRWFSPTDLESAVTQAFAPRNLPALVTILIADGPRPAPTFLNA